VLEDNRRVGHDHLLLFWNFFAIERWTGFSWTPKIWDQAFKELSNWSVIILPLLAMTQLKQATGTKY